MKRKVFHMLCLLPLAILLLTVPVLGAGDMFSEQAEALGTAALEEGVPREARDYLQGIGVSESADLGAQLGSVLTRIWAGAGEFFTTGLRNAAILLAVVMLCSFGGGFGDALGAKRSVSLLSAVGALSVTAVSVGSVDALIGLGKSTIEAMDTFSKVLLPTLAAATAAAGTPTGAAVKHLSAVFFSDILITVIQRVLFPAVYVYILLCVADACLEQGKLKKLSELLKKLVTWVLRSALAAFTGYTVLAGAAASAADSLAARTAASAFGAVPVVGGILSGATETVIAGVGVLRNAVGIFGAVAVVAICAAPCLRLAVQYLFFRLSSAVASVMGPERLTDLIEDLSGAIGLVLGMTASCALLLFLSIISSVSAVM